MHPTQLIGQHLDKEKIKYKLHTDINEICAFTGEKITEGYRVKDIIKKTFSDYDYLNNSEFVSPNAAACMEETFYLERKKKYYNLRNYSYLTTEQRITELPREFILDTLLNLDNSSVPFCICITETGYKYTAYKSAVNYDTDNFIITSETGLVHFDKEEVKSILPIIQSWYAAKTDQPKFTYFTKEEIKGNKAIDMQKIVAYGIDKFAEEEAILKPYQGTPLLNILAFIINKLGGEEE